MRKIRSMIGMPVVFQRKKIGRLVQAELSPDLKQLEGIWVECGFRGTRYIPAEQLNMIGQAAVLSDSSGKRKRCNASQRFLRAVSTDGTRLGAVVGAEIDEISFQVLALELSSGFWDDFYSGRNLAVDFAADLNRSEAIIMNSTQGIRKEAEV